MKMGIHFLVVLTLGMLSQAKIISRSDSCNHTEIVLRLSVNSKRSDSGNWTTQVRVDKGAGSETRDVSQDRDFLVNVMQTSVICNCSRDIFVVETDIIAPPSKPGSDYIYFKDLGFYKLYTTPETWREARDTCGNENSHLAIINSESEAQALRNVSQGLIKSSEMSSKDHLYLGFHDMYTGQFFTIYGNPLNRTEYTTWFNNTSGSNDENHCGTLHSGGGLSAVPCHWKLAFICEQELWE